MALVGTDFSEGDSARAVTSLCSNRNWVASCEDPLVSLVVDKACAGMMKANANDKRLIAGRGPGVEDRRGALERSYLERRWGAICGMHSIFEPWERYLTVQ